MLKQLGRLERTRSIIIVGFALLMAVSLIVFYAPGRNTNYLEPSKNTDVVAKVNGAEVTVADVALQKEAMQSRYGGQISLAQLGLTNENILEGVIQYLDDDDNIIYQDDVFSKLERYLKFCDEQGIEPQDLRY